MLPFLKRKEDVGSVSMPTETIKRKSDSGEEFDTLEVAAQDMLHAIASKDSKALAAAMRAAFELCDGEPHKEGPHE